MHRSRVSTLLIDTSREHAPQAAAFWSAALGVPAQSPPGEPQFTVLRDALPGFVTAVQAVDDEPRYHLDIESDDIEAEVARLLALGRDRGVELARVPHPASSRRPPALRHPVHSDPAFFAAHAQTWP